MAEVLSHVDAQGRALMVDVSGKPNVLRIARASGCVLLADATVELIKQNQIKKGDVLAVARIAGISAAKRTPELIPLCHTFSLDHVTVDCVLEADRVSITATATCIGRTGVEMEALTAVSVAGLTVYDMCKAVDKKMVIGEIRLESKEKHPVAGES